MSFKIFKDKSKPEPKKKVTKKVKKETVVPIQKIPTAEEVAAQFVSKADVGKPAEHKSTNPNDLVGKARPLYVKNILVNLGWEDFQAAALVGNYMKESDPDLKTTVDLKAQAKSLDWELSNNKKEVYRELKKSTDVVGAARAAVGFFKPKGWSADNPEKSYGWSERVTFAYKLM